MSPDLTWRASHGLAYVLIIDKKGWHHYSSQRMSNRPIRLFLKHACLYVSYQVFLQGHFSRAETKPETRLRIVRERICENPAYIYIRSVEGWKFTILWDQHWPVRACVRRCSENKFWGKWAAPLRTGCCILDKRRRRVKFACGYHGRILRQWARPQRTYSVDVMGKGARRFSKRTISKRCPIQKEMPNVQGCSCGKPTLAHNG